ncbi:hypothetical protein EW145_g1640 [Phellinidium pouzarii]|uniref:Uncharacterized protein n=1 Tax=Phellinidium pouzarii TaxID=167371 RepID=A0A4S4LEA4_9AGAM|nr:hypothetical protein EW145_g1640 [Phellinidium pouzarii]
MAAQMTWEDALRRSNWLMSAEIRKWNADDLRILRYFPRKFTASGVASLANNIGTLLLPNPHLMHLLRVNIHT